MESNDNETLKKVKELYDFLKCSHEKDEYKNCLKFSLTHSHSITDTNLILREELVLKAYGKPGYSD